MVFICEIESVSFGIIFCILICYIVKIEIAGSAIALNVYFSDFVELGIKEIGDK